MRRLLIAVAMLLCVAGLAQAQVVCVDGGYAFSNQYGSQLNLLPEGRSSFAGGMAIEYLRQPHFYLRSGLGYRAVGGKDTQNAPFTSKKGGRQANEVFHMLQLNTVVRTGYRIGAMEFYLGFGPKLDFLMGKREFKEKLFADYKTNRVLFGLRYEVGLDFWMAHDRVKMGLMCGYENDVSAFAKSEGNRLYNQSYGVQLSLGVRLGGLRSEASQAETADN